MEHRTDILMLWVSLTQQSRAELLQRFPPIHKGKITADHMTVAFRPTVEEIEAFNLGAEVELTVVGHEADGRGQAVVVEGYNSRNGTPHITISVAEGTKPVYSNELLSKGFSKLKDAFALKGHAVAVTKKMERLGLSPDT